mgnify:CR=1 FL=1|tara:strand:+ start:290 stop:1177 length:888 start_codon:yes stop_codon:yes gene_type:complete
MNKIFIQANNKQMIGAFLAKFAIEKNISKKIEVEIINSDDCENLNSFHGKTYLRKGIITKWDINDLQSFTLTRFFPPEIMNYKGKALVIDPDVFSIRDISSIFDMDLKNKSILARKVYNSDESYYWASSVMLLDCKKLKHWNKSELLEKLAKKMIDYRDLTSLYLENQDEIGELEEKWNHYDILNSETIFLHNTNRITQPWKTGLDIDFFYENKSGLKITYITKKFLKYILGNILKIKRYKVKSYIQHSDPNQISYFFNLCNEAIKNKVISIDYIRECIDKKYIRSDFLSLIDEY